uniref:BTB domain-containing protein n=1 Tax=Angiostrongylus cantonensis TaxID=6313 RepID=A0A158P8L3_ANGCA
MNVAGQSSDGVLNQRLIESYNYIDDDLVYSAEEHALITFKYITSENERHLDLVFESNGKRIAQANRLIVAAFSSNIEQELLKTSNGPVTLEIDPVTTGEYFMPIYDSPLLDEDEDNCEVHDEWHEIRFLEQLRRFRKESKFLDCNIVTGIHELAQFYSSAWRLYDVIDC